MEYNFLPYFEIIPDRVSPPPPPPPFYFHRNFYLPLKREDARYITRNRRRIRERERERER